MSGPYSEAWEAYRHAGWNGVVPLPPRKKANPPKGTTGEAGMWPSYADCMAWSEGPEAAGNVALRLPHNVLGIDVDAYDGKPGAATFADATTRWGALPPTWESSSRADGVSRIKFYRIPEGLHWPGELGPATELIQYRHRYAVVWPSVHPDTGATYRWITPEGITSTAIPDPDSLPLLPQAWVDGLTGGKEHHDTPRNDWGAAAVQSWVVTRTGSTDGPCARMLRAGDQATAELATCDTSAHGVMTAAVMRVVRLADEGHAGLVGALSDIHTAFITNVTKAGRPGRTVGLRVAEGEWQRAVVGAVNKVSASPSDMETCDCDGQLTGLIVGGAYPIDGTAALAPLVPLGTPRAGEEPAPEAEASSRERTSWWPRSLAAILSGEQEEPPPAHLARRDGERLFYDGKINALIGESESGKTWIALLAVVQAMRDGMHVTYLDFEDTAGGIVGRLRALGATSEQLLTQLDYIGPDETLNGITSADLTESLERNHPALIVLDGVNAAMTLLGLDLEKNKDATRFAQLLLRPLSAAADGACVVVIDHLPKNKENRGKGGIGAQAKRAMMTGCAISVEVIEPFGRGMSGRLKLAVDKDRPGHVRSISAEAMRVGTAILTSDPGTGGVNVVIEEPSDVTRSERNQGQRSMLMEGICEYLATGPQRTSLKGIREAMKGKALAVDEALEHLIRHGYVKRQTNPGRGFEHTLIRTYTVAEDLSSVSRVPACPERVPDTVGTSRREGVSRVPSRRGDTDTTPEAGSKTREEKKKTTGHAPKPATTDPIMVDGVLIDPRTGEVLEDTRSAP